MTTSVRQAMQEVQVSAARVLLFMVERDHRGDAALLAALDDLAHIRDAAACAKQLLENGQ